MTGPSLTSKVLIWVVDSGPQIVEVPFPTEILLACAQIPGVVGYPAPAPYDPAIYGQLERSTLPTVAKKVRGSSKYPPEQSLTLLLGAQLVVHSSEAYSLRPYELPLMSRIDSYIPVEANDQQQPQLPWFLTEVTQPRVTQLQEVAKTVAEILPGVQSPQVVCLVALVCIGVSPNLAESHKTYLTVLLVEGRWPCS